MHKCCPYNKKPGVLLVHLNFYFYIYSVPHRVVSIQPGIQHLKHLIFQDCAVHRVPLHKCTRIPASKSTSTKQFSHFSSTP